jgi:hypothetical protein
VLGYFLFYAVPYAVGVAAGFFAGWLGTVVVTLGVFLLIRLVWDTEPDEILSLVLAAFAAAGGLVGTFLRSQRRRAVADKEAAIAHSSHSRRDTVRR